MTLSAKNAFKNLKNGKMFARIVQVLKQWLLVSQRMQKLEELEMTAAVLMFTLILSQPSHEMAP